MNSCNYNNINHNKNQFHFWVVLVTPAEETAKRILMRCWKIALQD